MLTVLSPSIRGQVNPDLYSAQEKAAMANTIAVLASYGLSYSPSFADAANNGLGIGGEVCRHTTKRNLGIASAAISTRNAPMPLFPFLTQHHNLSLASICNRRGKACLRFLLIAWLPSTPYSKSPTNWCPKLTSSSPSKPPHSPRKPQRPGLGPGLGPAAALKRPQASRQRRPRSGRRLCGWRRRKAFAARPGWQASCPTRYAGV